MDSEISNLKDPDGYVLFAEEFPITKVHVLYLSYSIRAKAISDQTGLIPSGLPLYPLQWPRY